MMVTEFIATISREHYGTSVGVVVYYNENDGEIRCIWIVPASEYPKSGFGAIIDALRHAL